MPPAEIANCMVLMLSTLSSCLHPTMDNNIAWLTFIRKANGARLSNFLGVNAPWHWLLNVLFLDIVFE